MFLQRIRDANRGLWPAKQSSIDLPVVNLGNVNRKRKSESMDIDLDMDQVAGRVGDEPVGTDMDIVQTARNMGFELLEIPDSIV
ncbi:hypothetical protein N0V83_010863 [Neocucurbitaria cava]|uniref:Uncharacterized protein n=1 Tax=Neocucurbitaria cava TaxID=798079 RepID=A0A9W8XX20_9PLEO|nr:hypothetical protein N0V83_010863 [Neocucurbitaria cava]